MTIICKYFDSWKKKEISFFKKFKQDKYLAIVITNGPVSKGFVVADGIQLEIIDYNCLLMNLSQHFCIQMEKVDINDAQQYLQFENIEQQTLNEIEENDPIIIWNNFKAGDIVITKQPIGLGSTYMTTLIQQVV